MKKIFLLVPAMLCFFLSYSQTLVPTPQTVENNGTVTLTATDEFAAAHFGSITYQPNYTSTSSPAAGYGIYLNLTDLTLTQNYSQTSNSPSKFTFKISNSINQPITVTLYFMCTIINDLQSTSNPFQKSITITVKPTAPVQTTFYNAALSKVFVKNNCDATTIGSSVTYTVPANKYSGSTQADADSKAQNDINANGQNYANANGQCLTRYYNTEISGSFTRNNCGQYFVSNDVIPYTIIAGRFSATSQAEANSLAQSALNTEGQANANSLGTCKENRYMLQAKYKLNNPCITSGQAAKNVYLNTINLSSVGTGFSSTGIFVYSNSSGNATVPAGYYRDLSAKNSADGGRVRVYIVSDDGEILAYQLCAN